MPDAAAVSATRGRALRALERLEKHGWRVVNNIYTQCYGNHIALRGGMHKPGRDASDEQIEGMRALGPDDCLGDDFFHFSPLKPSDCYAGPMSLISRFWTDPNARPIAGFQISQAHLDDNRTWPDHLVQLRFETARLGQARDVPRLKDGCAVVLQLGPQLIAGLREGQPEVDPDRLVQWLAPFATIQSNGRRPSVLPITHVLWDVSGGTGDPINPSEAVKALSAVQTEFPQLLIGAAGNLSATTMSLLLPLVEKSVRLSVIDAASALRDDDDLYHPGSGANFVQKTADWVEKGRLWTPVVEGHQATVSRTKSSDTIGRDLVASTGRGQHR